uniref:centrosomal protein of 57 kDa isoform X2 n=1 Tax=Doryrhamphus excisus TaxID=161450 RepID=UPI0025AE59A7|nr:centrosomal protein of 57 kDa isoform X2 [Doryrhamphus excisus]
METTRETDYPAHRPWPGTLEHHTPSDTYDPYRPPSPSKGYPETNGAAILSALRNLQEKIRRLELEKQHVDLDHAIRGDAATRPRAHRMAQRAAGSQTDARKPTNEQYNCNQALVTQLAAAESRCVNLERQLGHMRKMLRNAKGEKSSLLKQQVTMEASRSAHKQAGPVSEQVQLQKMQEYLRLTRTQGQAEVKIEELEQKLQEEEHQRKLLQDKAKQLQVDLEANRILLQSSSPRWTKEKKSILKKQWSYSEPHYRLNLNDVPFVAGTSVGGSHSVRANVQSVLSLLKRHQPQLCNSHVLDNNSKTFCSDAGSSRRRRSDASSGSASSASGELSDLLQGLQEELRLMSLEQDELMRQLDRCVCLQERKQLEREQEQLLLKIERKGDQISKLYRHKIQIKKLRKEAHTRQASRIPPPRVSTLAVSTRGRSAGAVKSNPGEKSRCNLKLLKDMKALQTSLRT